jgi:TPR repeat protein
VPIGVGVWPSPCDPEPLTDDARVVDAPVSMARTQRFALLSLAIVGTGCGSGTTAGSAVRPKEAKASEVIGLAEVQCSASDDDRTLVVDLDPADRKTIEEMVGAKRAVPVVAYDCKSLRILPTCKLESEFTYIGSSAREDVIQLENVDKIAANIPLASASLRASVQAGRRIDIALAEVGSRNSAVELVAKPQLVELRAGDCATATHFVYKVDVGAFAIAQTTSGDVSGAAQIFEAGSSAESRESKKSSKKEGRLDACAKAQSDDRASPDGCGVPLRVHLRRILPTAEQRVQAEVAAEQAKTESVFSSKSDPPCPDGLVRAEGGSCVTPSPKIVYQCRPTDLAECAAQCDKAHAGSCRALGRMRLFGSPTSATEKVERDPEAAAVALERACIAQKARPVGCDLLVEAYAQIAAKTQGDPAPTRAKAERALEHGCSRGDAPSCAAWGTFFEHGSPRLKVVADPERGVRYYVRACGLGDQTSCGRAASLYVEGSKRPDGTWIFKRDPAQGLALLDSTCKQGAARACEQLAMYLTAPRFGVRDEARAATLFRELCAKNDKTACAEHALLAMSGAGGVPKDPDGARKKIEELCYDAKVHTACYGVALLADTGLGGVATNKPKAVEYYRSAIFVKDAAARLALLLEAGAPGVAPDLAAAAKNYAAACLRPAFADANVCRKAAELGEKTKTASPFMVASFWRHACRMAPGDKPTCDRSREPAKLPGPPKGAPADGGK